ncbi:MAG: hypothetical protein GEU75_02550 [Dehalococcoidia bacterium]|nr:hypothetical protein [Dehalococcoidia bacterium]
MEVGSPRFRTHKVFLTEILIPAYAELGSLVFAYSQGSMVEGLSDSSDIDTVFVWASTIPQKQLRPPDGIADGHPFPRTFDRQETLWVAGQEFGVSHITQQEWAQWLQLLDDGEGCSGYPMPVIAAHGLLSGVLLHDPAGTGSELQLRLNQFPESLRLKAVSRARLGLPTYLEVLEKCDELGDGLLFHGELSRASCLAWIGWFSAQRRYWPLEKRLGLRLRLMDRNDLAEMEERVWSSGPKLNSRLEAFKELIEQLLAEMP